VPSIFVDSAYYIAVFRPRDQLHARALAVGSSLARDGMSFVTTDAVLVEFLSFVARTPAGTRLAAVEFVQDVRTRPALDVVPQTPALFDAALDLYRRRADKTYSMVDCISMVVCRQRKIRDVLTADNDFAQEGFTVLL